MNLGTYITTAIYGYNIAKALRASGAMRQSFCAISLLGLSTPSSRLSQVAPAPPFAVCCTLNQGQLPSMTQIILLNGGKGSPSSANIYRKTYLLKVQQQQASTDPLGAFPETVANAVKTMWGTLEAQVALQAQLEVALAEHTERQTQRRQTILKHESLVQDMAALRQPTAYLPPPLKPSCHQQKTAVAVLSQAYCVP